MSVHRPGAAQSGHLVFREPVILGYGKSDKALLGALLGCPGVSLGCSLREGIVIHSQVHDRGLGAKFRCALTGYWEECVTATDDGNMDGASDSLLHLYCSAGCALHDGHNALRWSYEH
eukprot:48941-Amphidinium_carterae.1